MTLRPIPLVERHTREVHLLPDDAAYLLTHARHLIDVQPVAFRADRYRLTAREYVGWYDTPALRVAITPKVPWPNVRMLLGLGGHESSASAPVALAAGLLETLGRELVARLREVTRLGLISGYRDREATLTFLRGKLRAAEQIRDAAVRAFPDRFHVTESVLDLDTPWNRVPRVVVAQLLANPALPGTIREEMLDAIRPLEGIPIAAVTDQDFAEAVSEPRAAHYAPLLELCRILHDGFAAAGTSHGGTGGFLINLSQAFERYLTEGLTTHLGDRPGWSVGAHPVITVGPVDLQPDILVRRRGTPAFVLDAKWKAPGASPDAGDLHQILAYAATTGANRVGLVYPGRRFAVRELCPAPAQLRVYLMRVQVMGTVAECAAAMSRFARFLVRMSRSGQG